MTNVVESSIFQDTRVELDGYEFRSCRFERCLLVFKGTASFGLVNSGFQDCQWSLEGPAGLTVGFLQSLYHGVDGGDRIVEQLFDQIRKGGGGIIERWPREAHGLDSKKAT